MDEYNIYEGAFSGPQIDNILGNSTRQDAIAIVSSNNTHIAITAGQYVYVKNHGYWPEGLYKANQNIQENGTLYSTTLDALPNGALNELTSTLKYISVQLPLSTLGTSWSQTSRRIGSASSLFGISGGKIVAINMFGGNFNPSANAIFALYNDDIYVAATQDTTLSDSNSANRWIHVIYHD